MLSAFNTLDLQVVGLSVDRRENLAELSDRLGLEFPLVGELRYPDAVDAIGAYRNDGRSSFHATGIVLSPDQRVEAAVYSASNIGRLMPEEVMRVFG